MSAYNKSRLISAIECFNSGRYFECHEIIEDIWFDVHDETKPVYQGLLHFATALYHLKNKNNPKGALLQLDISMLRLQGYNSDLYGIDIKTVLSQVQNLKNRIIKKEALKRLPEIKMI